MLSLVQLAGRSGARIWLFDYGVHRCEALACFTPRMPRAPRYWTELSFLVSYRTLAARLGRFQGASLAQQSIRDAVAKLQ